ncbi:MAG: LacI family DNA-binding transcriptional regulator [Polyangiaceae bacterium]|nr:LacI family DNA-binding transcriptional regulator [Polyangiaceae bacterium]
MGIGIPEIAKLCGVSIATVDRALHNRPGISEATRAKILACAKNNSYQPNLSARALSRGASFVGALVFAGALATPNELQVILGARKELRAHEYPLFIVPYATDAEFRAAFSDLEQLNCAALILVGIGKTKIPETSTPVVAAIHHLQGTNAFGVAPNEERTGRTAVEYLRGMGHRRIAFLDHNATLWANLERKRGFMLGAQELGVSVVSGVATDLPELVQREQVTAAFCHNDGLAIQAIRAVESHGMSVPEDVSVLGVDDRTDLPFLQPNLTTLRYDFEYLGALAGRRVLALLSGQPFNEQMPDLPIIERGTVKRIAPGI